MLITEWPASNIPLTKASFGLFLQRMANRIVNGHHQYGHPKRRKRYMTRIGLELEAYQETGNMEHLYNIANYCWLESEAPENEHFHIDNTVDSVTRGKI